MSERERKIRRLSSGFGRLLGALPAMILGAAVGIALYWGLSPATKPATPGGAPEAHDHRAEPTVVWTCSMHPEVSLPKPGLCPKCGMKLIPRKVAEPDAMDGPPVFTASENVKALMNIQTAAVERLFPTAEIRMVGKVEYDETRLAYITAWAPGRLDRLFVDYTGVAVRKGDHMVYIYSPELYSAQAELLQARKAVQDLQRSDVDIVRRTAEATVEAAREKLRLLGLTDEQVAEVEQRGKAEDHVTIYAPISGIVIHKDVQEGMYVQTGTRIYTLADLSRVWVKLDAYESDLSWLRYGQKTEFSSVSYPGETFIGTIAFIDPVLNPVTRTVKVRVNVPNPQGKLKPEMFVNAVVHARVAAAGRVMDPSLAGKWMCPMHPEVVKDGPDKCDLCGMPLVKAETLGYVSAAPTEQDKPLVIPVSAALVTGTRAIVYVEKPEAPQPTYEGRQIVLGPRAGGYYLVRRGLAEGERVVTRGNFKIDSALQIQAKPSMMTPQGGASSAGHQHGQPGGGTDGAKPVGGMELPVRFRQELERVLADADKARQAAQDGEASAARAVPEKFRQQLDAVFAGYFAVGKALAGDDAAQATAGLNELSAAIAKVDMSLLGGPAREAWMRHKAALADIHARVPPAADIKKLRELFAALSDEAISLARRFPPQCARAYYLLRCPMAFAGRGGAWLQGSRQIRNPYFGSAMPECGDVQEVICGQEPPTSAPAAAVTEHRHG